MTKMRISMLALAALAAATSLSAQAQSTLPGGWQARADRANAPMQNVKFVTMGDGYHVSLGPSVILYNPQKRAQGAYRARATFTQTRAPQHPEAYGLLVGGQKLDAASQDYLYFLVRGDGKFLVKHRAGAETHTLFDWTEHAAIKRADAAGKATNTLAIEATAAGARFLVNGTEVAKLPRGGQLKTDGVVGLRINHNLDVHVSGFGVEPIAAGSR
jgi:hypothetical protein